MTSIMEEWYSNVPTDFMRHAKCRGTDTNTFFLEKGKPASPVIELCNGKTVRGRVVEPPCPVREQCLEYALSLPAWCSGIWGGTTQRDRRRIRYERETNAA